jgi:hypothetical protein
LATILVCPDTHAPFEHPDAFAFLEKLANQWSVDEFIHLGDEGDFHGMSLKFAADPDGFSPGHEYELMIESMKKLYQLFPKARVCESNHTARPLRKALHFGIPRIFLKQYHEFMQAPKGWSWHPQIEIEKVIYMHGEPFNGTSWMRAHNVYRQSVVMGHLHSKAGVVYSNTPYSRVFSANMGCLINTEAYAFAYGRVYPEKPCLGAGIVIDGKEAYFIPLPTQSGLKTRISEGKIKK